MTIMMHATLVNFPISNPAEDPQRVQSRLRVLDLDPVS